MFDDVATKKRYFRVTGPFFDWVERKNVRCTERDCNLTKQADENLLD